MIRHVASIAEIVEDFDAAVRFYREVLGLKVDLKPDGDYAEVEVGGVLHFGIWRRSHAALTVFGDASRMNEIPLGFTVGFEVNTVPSAEARLLRGAAPLIQGSHLEPWGQRTCRFLSTTGALCEVAETPGARRVAALNPSPET